MVLRGTILISCTFETPRVLNLHPNTVSIWTFRYHCFVLGSLDNGGCLEVILASLLPQLQELQNDLQHMILCNSPTF